VQRFQADAENLRGSSFIIAGSLKGFEDKHLLCLFDSSADAQPDCVGIVGRSTQRRLAESGREMLGLDHPRVAHDDRTLDRVAQFANVSRPGISVELVQHRFTYGADLARVLAAHLSQKQLHQSGNVFLMLPQRRHVNVKYVEPIIKITA
jgi:hypothetical protein